jgi:hypothetical protein
MWICSKCGEKNDGDFCENCGERRVEKHTHFGVESGGGGDAPSITVFGSTFGILKIILGIIPLFVFLFASLPAFTYSFLGVTLNVSTYQIFQLNSVLNNLGANWLYLAVSVLCIIFALAIFTSIFAFIGKTKTLIAVSVITATIGAIVSIIFYFGIASKYKISPGIGAYLIILVFVAAAAISIFLFTRYKEGYRVAAKEGTDFSAGAKYSTTAAADESNSRSQVETEPTKYESPKTTGEIKSTIRPGPVSEKVSVESADSTRAPLKSTMRTVDRPLDPEEEKKKTDGAKYYSKPDDLE